MILSGLFFLLIIITNLARNRFGYQTFGDLIITLTEWGDKTQIAAAIFATQYEGVFVFIGTITTLTILIIVAIFFGKFISSRINKRIVNRIAGIVFIILGITFFVF